MESVLFSNRVFFLVAFCFSLSLSVTVLWRRRGESMSQWRSPSLAANSRTGDCFACSLPIELVKKNGLAVMGVTVYDGVVT